MKEMAEVPGRVEVESRRVESVAASLERDVRVGLVAGAQESGRIARKLIGDEVCLDRAPRVGTDPSQGFAALEELRARRHGWSDENPPRLERLARVVPC